MSFFLQGKVMHRLKIEGLLPLSAIQRIESCLAAHAEVRRVYLCSMTKILEVGGPASSHWVQEKLRHLGYQSFILPNLQSSQAFVGRLPAIIACLGLAYLLHIPQMRF